MFVERGRIFPTVRFFRGISLCGGLLPLSFFWEFLRRLFYFGEDLIFHGSFSSVCLNPGSFLADFPFFRPAGSLRRPEGALRVHAGPLRAALFPLRVAGNFADFI